MDDSFGGVQGVVQGKGWVFALFNGFATNWICFFCAVTRLFSPVYL